MRNPNFSSAIKETSMKMGTEIIKQVNIKAFPSKALYISECVANVPNLPSQSGHALRPS